MRERWEGRKRHPTWADTVQNITQIQKTGSQPHSNNEVSPPAAKTLRAKTRCHPGGKDDRFNAKQTHSIPSFFYRPPPYPEQNSQKQAIDEISFRKGWAEVKSGWGRRDIRTRTPTQLWFIGGVFGLKIAACRLTITRSGSGNQGQPELCIEPQSTSAFMTSSTSDTTPPVTEVFLKSFFCSFTITLLIKSGKSK